MRWIMVKIWKKGTRAMIVTLSVNLGLRKNNPKYVRPFFSFLVFVAFPKFRSIWLYSVEYVLYYDLGMCTLLGGQTARMQPRCGQLVDSGTSESAMFGCACPCECSGTRTPPDRPHPCPCCRYCNRHYSGYL